MERPKTQDISTINKEAMQTIPANQETIGSEVAEDIHEDFWNVNKF